MYLDRAFSLCALCCMGAAAFGVSAPAPASVTPSALVGASAPAPVGASLTTAPPTSFDPSQFASLTTASLPLENGEPVIMRVNGRPVTWDDLTIQTRMAGAAIMSQHPGKERHIMAALLQPVSEALILQELYREFAVTRNLAPQSAEIDLRQSEIRSSQNPAVKQAIAFLSSDQIRQLVTDSLVHEKVDKYIGDLATSAPPSLQEIATFVSELKPTTSPIELTRARHIVIRATPDMSEFALNDAKARAEEVFAKLESGLDFATAARQYSQDRFTAFQGGNVGYFSAGAMFMEFEAAAAKLAVGETSGIVRTPVGYHIIQVTERQPDDLRLQLDKHKRQMAVMHWKEKAVQGAKVERYLQN